MTAQPHSPAAHRSAAAAPGRWTSCRWRQAGAGPAARVQIDGPLGGRRAGQEQFRDLVADHDGTPHALPRQRTAAPCAELGQREPGAEAHTRPVAAAGERGGGRRCGPWRIGTGASTWPGRRRSACAAAPGRRAARPAAHFASRRGGRLVDVSCSREAARRAVTPPGCADSSMADLARSGPGAGGPGGGGFWCGRISLSAVLASAVLLAEGRGRSAPTARGRQQDWLASPAAEQELSWWTDRLTRRDAAPALLAPDAGTAVRRRQRRAAAPGGRAAGPADGRTAALRAGVRHLVVRAAPDGLSGADQGLVGTARSR